MHSGSVALHRCLAVNPQHEIVTKFRELGFPLNATLEEMLNEDPAHHTERRGCGLTQATRYLAQRVNQPREHRSLEDVTLFHQWLDKRTCHAIEQRVASGDIATWRSWDRHPPTLPDGRCKLTEAVIHAEASRHALLRQAHTHLEREESVLVAKLIQDIVLPIDADQEGCVELVAWPEKIAVGSCPLAERWFLEIAHGFIPRKGRCNFILDEHNRPVLLEKINMGESHSCISLIPCVINGVRIPAGSLLAVCYDEEQVTRIATHPDIPGDGIYLADCSGFRMLRLTTLAVSPENRARAFSVHFKAQKDGGLFEPEKTLLEQLKQIAIRACADLGSR